MHKALHRIYLTANATILHASNEHVKAAEHQTFTSSHFEEAFLFDAVASSFQDFHNKRSNIIIKVKLAPFCGHSDV